MLLMVEVICLGMFFTFS